MNLRKIIVVGSGLSILAISVIGMNVFSGMKEEPKKEEKPIVHKYVKTAQVDYTNVKTEIVAFGRVRTAQTLDMIAEVSGRMEQANIPLKEGQNFRKGQLLFKIDDEEVQLNLYSQKSNFMRDLAAIMPDLRLDFPDNYPSWEKYFSSIRIDGDLLKLPEYLSSQEKTFLATKNIFSNYYTIKAQESRLKKYAFIAPFDGIIYSVNLHNGSYVNAGSNIARLIQTGNMELKVDVRTSEINWVDKGSEAMIYDENGNNWKAVVTRVGEFVNQDTQSIDVFLSIKSNDQNLFDGQFLRAVMPSRIIDNSMIIPRNVIFNGDEVFVVEDTILSVQKVTIHKINEQTVVFSGLKEGSDLVIEPLINAFNGMTVRKLEEQVKDIDLEEKESKEKTTALAN